MLNFVTPRFSPQEMSAMFKPSWHIGTKYVSGLLRLMEAEKNFFAKCGRLPEPYEYTAENGLPMYSVFCRLAKEAFEEIIRAQFLETQELSGPVLTM